MTDILKAVRDYIATSTDIVALIGSTHAGSTLNCYPDILPPNVCSADFTTPAIVYQMIGAYGQRHLAQSSGLCNSRIQIDCFARTRLAANALAEQVRLHFDTLRGSMSTESVHSCTLMDRLTDYEPPEDKSEEGRYRVILDFSIWFGESLPHRGST